MARGNQEKRDETARLFRYALARHPQCIAELLESVTRWRNALSLFRPTGYGRSAPCVWRFWPLACSAPAVVATSGLPSFSAVSLIHSRMSGSGVAPVTPPQPGLPEALAPQLMTPTS